MAEEEKPKESPPTPPPPDRVEKTEAQKKWDDIINSALSDATDEEVDVMPTPSKRIDKTPPEEVEKEVEQEKKPIEKYKIDLNIPEISGETVVLKKGRKEEKEEAKKEGGPSRKKRSKEKTKEGKGMDEEYKEEISKITESIKDLQEEIDSLYSVTSNLSSDVSNISGKVSQMDSKVEELENVKDEYRKIEEMVRELSGLYDLITADINPFMEMKSTPDEVKPTKSRGTSKTGKESEIGLAKGKGRDLNDAAMIEWAEFLSERVPPAKIEDILNYYQDIDWIDQQIKKKVLSYMEGVKREKGASKGAKDKVISEDGEIVSEDWRLTPTEHQKSLQYIKNIKGEYSELDIDEYLQEVDSGQEED